MCSSIFSFSKSKSVLFTGVMSFWIEVNCELGYAEGCLYYDYCVCNYNDLKILLIYLNRKPLPINLEHRHILFISHGISHAAST